MKILDLEEMKNPESLNWARLLLLEKALLRLKFLILSDQSPKKESTEETLASEINSKQGKLAEFISEKGEVESLEIFRSFPEVSRRQLKRDLNKLIIIGMVAKKVLNHNQTFYFSVLDWK